MLDSTTRTRWTVVYIPLEELEPTAKLVDLANLGTDQPVRADIAHTLITGRCLCEVLAIYPTEDLDEALETYRAANASKIPGL